MVREGERVQIRKLIRDDVDKMQKWKEYSDPLYFHYSFPQLDREESDMWYKMKTKRFSKKIFAIDHKGGELIGYISIRNIKWIKRECELGIVFDANYVNRGYGTEAMLLFLDYYFCDLNMTKIILRTAKYNKRAIRCYGKCGFKIEKESLDEFEDPEAELFYNPKHHDLKKLFVIKEDKKKTKYMYMSINKNEFYNKINEIITKLTI